MSYNTTPKACLYDGRRYCAAQILHLQDRMHDGNALSASVVVVVTDDNDCRNSSISRNLIVSCHEWISYEKTQSAVRNLSAILPNDQLFY